MEQIRDDVYSENGILFVLEDEEDNRWRHYIGEGGHGPDHQKFIGVINIDGREYSGHFYLESSDGTVMDTLLPLFGREIFEHDAELINVFGYNFIEMLGDVYTVKSPSTESLRIYKIRGILNEQ